MAPSTPSEAPDLTSPDRTGAGAVQGSWRSAVRHCLVVYLCVRLALFLLGLLTVALVPAQPAVQVPGWSAQPPSEGWHAAVTAWERADALWFLKIASSGYDEGDGSPAFFPMFPVLVRGVGLLTGGSWLLAGFVVSNLALLVALVVLHRLTSEELGERTARRTVVYLCVFPTAFFLFSPFSEPVFLAFVVGALYAARHRAWPLAAVLGAGAALTRQVGVVLCLVLAAEAVHQLVEDRRAQRLSWRPVVGRALACAGPAVGTLSYLAYWQGRAGDWHVPFDAQATGWSRDVTFPPVTLWRALDIGTQFLGVYPGGYFTVDLLLLLVALAAAVWVAVRTRAVFGTYAWLSLLFPLVFVFAGRPLMAVPRYLVVVFPLFWALSRFADRFRAGDLVLGLSAAGLALLGALAISWLPIF